MADRKRSLNGKPRGRHPVDALSTTFARNVAGAGRYCDGNALYLQVKPSGARSWVQRLVIRGRRRELGLGGFPLVSLGEARAQALSNRKAARAGGDPLAERRRANGMPTFAAAAERVWADKHPGWRNDRHSREWLASLERWTFPRIGRMAVSEVTSADVLDTLRRVWHTRPETARRLRQRVSAVMEWAVAMQLRADNPCDRIGPVLGPQKDLVRHMPALHHAEVAGAIRTICASGATPAVKLAFEFLVLTAARSGEVRGARWEEVDLAARVWTIPPVRTKALREHRVPLSRRAGADPRCGAGARRWNQPARVSRPGRQADRRDAAVAAASQSQDRGRAPRLPLELPRLGGGDDQLPAGGDRIGPGARGDEPDRGGVCALGPFRAEAPAHERVGGLPGGRPGAVASAVMVMTLLNAARQPRPARFCERSRSQNRLPAVHISSTESARECRAEWGNCRGVARWALVSRGQSQPGLRKKYLSCQAL